MMVVGRIRIVHLPDQVIQAGFIVLLEPERNGNLLGRIYGAKNLGSRAGDARRLRERRNRDQQNRKTGKQHGGKSPTFVLGHLKPPLRYSRYVCGADGCISGKPS